jgi:hypothetical protein
MKLMILEKIRVIRTYMFLQPTRSECIKLLFEWPKAEKEIGRTVPLLNRDLWRHWHHRAQTQQNTEKKSLE